MCLRPAGFRVVFMAMIGTTSTPLRSPWSSKGPACRPEARFFFAFVRVPDRPSSARILGCATSKRCRTGGTQATTVTRYPALSLSPASPRVNEGAGQHSKLRPWAAKAEWLRLAPISISVRLGAPRQGRWRGVRPPRRERKRSRSETPEKLPEFTGRREDRKEVL
jgi:hypothetical protein